jgi:hypothetical protein
LQRLQQPLRVREVLAAGEHQHEVNRQIFERLGNRTPGGGGGGTRIVLA